MFIVHKKGLEARRQQPDLPLRPTAASTSACRPASAPATSCCLENGGVYAVANLRGGGEYGEAWHKAGMLRQEAERLRRLHRRGRVPGQREVHVRRTGWPSRAARTAACWWARCMTQRPELFGVALPAVGVMDMLRFHKFTVGWGWTVEYGSSDNADEFKYLYAYSPLHNLKPGVCYPATLVTTADHDDRVVPAHSFKFAATLQEKPRPAPSPVAHPHRDALRPRLEQPEQGHRGPDGPVVVHVLQHERQTDL
ncbi:MAG: prolyl oligopeptidase family serine peptidase [Ignavibacteriales bacterium]|nr:prolyl oligopeptidase family serine peptidase [Ignavibacteriales bacterium]